MKLGVINAKSLLGKEVVNQLIEQKIEYDELALFDNLEEGCYKGLDVIINAGSSDDARRCAKEIEGTKTVLIDCSSAFRTDSSVPLVVAEINGDDCKKNKGIIANPNCTTIIGLLAVYGISKLSKIKSMIISTYQAASGAGEEGIDELINQHNAIANNSEFDINSFTYQLAYNAIPAIGSLSDDDYSLEDLKMEKEGRRIMHLPDLKATCTSVRVPLIRSHCMSITVITEEKVDLLQAKKAISETENVEVVDDYLNNKYPMPMLTDKTNKVLVGRIREDRVIENGITLFACGDQLVKGQAGNVVSIIKYL